MADVQSNIHVNIDTSEALASIKLLQKQISAFHSSMAKSGAAAAAVSANMQQNLINSLNASGKWSASMRTVKTTTESFTEALEKNKLSMRDYYRYSMGATKSFGRFFRSEWDTINKVARERVKDLQTQYIKMGRDANGAMKAIAVRPLALDMQNLGTQTQIAAQRQALLNQMLKQGSTNLLNFGKNTQWAGRQLMVGFTIPLAYLGTTASRTFMQLEEQAIRFKRVYGEMFTTGEETDKMLTDIKMLAKEFTKYGVTVEKTMEMAASAAAMGKMGADLLAQVNQATRLAVLGGVEQEQALETTISLTNAFGISAEELAKKIDFLNSVENQTVVSIEDLTIAIPKAGPVVQQLGGNVEDLAFFLTAMKEGGINASEGANALKSGLASLINPTDKASEMLAEMGINIKGIVEANKGNVKGIVLDFASALDALDPLNRARAIEQLFGKFQFSRLSTLFQNVIGQGTQASRVLKLTQATTEELAILSERELKRVEESTTYKFKKAVEDLKVTLAPVGEQFLKAITPIVEFVSKILEGFNNLSDGTKKFIVILTTVLGGIGPIFLMTFGLLANGIANIIKMFVSIKGVFNRAGQSSTVLGNQVNYLTSEQLEAAAVASSLNQAHTTLKQTFTSETAALNALIAAYRRAISAQAGFMGPGIGKTPRKGFASGTKKVKPFYFAKGTDTVPAMLTPGEAVIPAGPAQHPANKPAIAYMVSGGILPQHAKGSTKIKVPPTVNFGGQTFTASRQSSASIVTGLITEAQKASSIINNIDDIIKQALTNVSKNSKITAENFKQEMSRITSGTVAFSGKKLSGMVGTTRAIQGKFAGNAGVVAAHGTPGVVLSASQANKLGAQLAPGVVASQLMNTKQNVRMLSNLTFPMPASFNKGMMTGTEGAKWVGQNRARFTSMIAEQNKLSPNHPGLLEFGKIVGQALKRVGNTAVSESQFEEIIEQALKRDLDAAAKGALLKSKNTFATAQIAGVAGREGHGGIQRVNLPSNAAGQTFAGLQLGKGSYRTQDISKYHTQADKFVVKSIRQRAKNFAMMNAKAFELGVREVLQVNSPSKRLVKIGQDSGKGLVVGAQEYVDDAKATGQKLGGAIVQGGATQAQMAAASRQKLYGSAVADAQQKSLRRQIDKLEKRSQARDRVARRSSMSLYGRTGPIDPAEKSLRRQLERQSRMQALAEKRAYQQSVVAGAVAAGAQKTGTGTTAKRGIAARYTQWKADRTAAGKGTIGPGGAMMAASGLMMAASMAPGQVGETAQKLMMPLMALTMVLPLLTNPIGALVAVVASAGIAIYALNQKFKESQENAIKLATAMGTSQDAIRDLSEFAGTVSAGEYMDRVRENRLLPFTPATGKTTFGESYVKSEKGQALVTASQQTLQKVGKSKVISDMSSQLSTAVIAGSLNMDQAKSIAANVAKQLGDASISIKVIAQITELLGPDGKAFTDSPITVATKMSEDSIAQAQANLEQLKGQVRGAGLVATEMGRVVKVAGAATAFGVVGAFAGARTGAFIGARLGAVLGPKGAIAGAVIGTIAGIAIAYKQSEDAAKKLGEQSGAAVASMMNALNAQQELSDALDAYYIKKIEEAKAEGNIAEAKRLQVIYDREKRDLALQQKKTTQDLMALYSEADTTTQESLMTGAQNALQLAYKDDVNAQMILPNVNTQLEKLQGETGGALRYLLTIEMANKNIDPSQVNTLLNLAGGDVKKQEQMYKILINVGATGAGQFSQIASMIENPDLQAEFTLKVSMAKTKEDAEKLMDFAANIMAMDGVIDADIYLNAAYRNSAVQKELDKVFSGLEEKDVKTVDVAYKINPKLKLTGNMGDAFDEEYFDKLKDVASKERYITVTSTIVAMGKFDLEKDPSFVTWAAENGYGTANGGINYAKISFPKLRGLYAQAMGQKVTEAGVTDNTGTDPGTPPGGSGDKTVKSSPLDDLVKKLRDVRKNQIKVTEGWSASRKALDNLFGGKKTIDVFSGIQQDLMKLGAKGNFIELIVGMDPKQYEAQKRKLFEFDNKDNIIGLKRDAKNIQEALNSIVAGEFQSGLLQQQQNLKDQATAYNKLRNSGLSAAQAYELIGDAAFASMIAGEKNTKVTQGLIDLYKKVDQESKRAQARKNVIQDTENFAADKALKQTMVARGFSIAERMAVLSDSNLTEMAKNGQWGPAFKARLQQIFDSIEFKQSVFDDGFNKAMEAFDAQENKIELDFQFKTLADQNIIQDAQDRIAGLQYQVDDWEAQLVGIEDQEKLINEKYDKRFTALDAIRTINEQIARQQKNQLTLADALSQGDISAAARAVQEMRAQQATDALDAQKKSMEAAKENALANVRNAQGYTRIQIESQIKNLRDQIFVIEEKELEPAQERLRIEEAKKRELIESITVLGKSRLEWTAVKNSIDLARTSSKEYTDAMQTALDMVKDIVNYWNGLNTTITTTHLVVTKTQEEPKPEPKKGKQGVVWTPTSRFAGHGFTEYATEASGGLIRHLSAGGIFPAMGSDIVPAMLTPGEFVMRKYAVDNFGVDRLKAINNGTYSGESVYNYNLSVNVKSDANADDIARTVIAQIKQVDSKRLRGGRL